MSHFNPHDKYFKRAKEEGYRARSVFKLEGIQSRFHLLKPGMKVLDLGCAPGSFLQYIGQQVGDKGIAIGFDLQQIDSFQEKQIQAFQVDIYDEAMIDQTLEHLNLKQFDLITSDLAPKTTGIPFVDGGASLELNLQVLELAKRYLRRGGGVVMKILSGFNEGDLIGEARKLFKQVKKYRPEAIRKSSHESYIIGLNKN